MFFYVDKPKISCQNRRSSRITPRFVRQLSDGESIYHTFKTTGDPDSLMVSESLCLYTRARCLKVRKCD